MSESNSNTALSEEAQPALTVRFVNLAAADQATFQRVLSFFAAKGQQFEVTQSPYARITITDEASATTSPVEVAEGNLLLVVSDNDDCQQGDMQLKRPLLVTRVMRSLEMLVKQLPAAPTIPSNSQHTNNPTPTNSATTDAGHFSENAYLALVIDDSSAIRKQLEIELRTSGIRSEFAESGEEALEKITQTQYDLIFLDIMMPGIDGYETCDRIRQTPNYKKTPVIMLSGKTTPLDEVKGVLAGASTYLTKPLKHQQFQEVTTRITRWLDEFSSTS